MAMLGVPTKKLYVQRFGIFVREIWASSLEEAERGFHDLDEAWRMSAYCKPEENVHVYLYVTRKNNHWYMELIRQEARKTSAGRVCFVCGAQTTPKVTLDEWEALNNKRLKYFPDDKKAKQGPKGFLLIPLEML